MANNKKKNQNRNSNTTNNYRNNSNKYSRYQKNEDKYKDDLDATVNLDTSFIEARGKNRKKVVEKTLENNRKEFENLQREERKEKSNSSLHLIIVLLVCLCVGLIGFDIYYFTNINDNKPRKEIIYKEQKVVEEVVDENIGEIVKLIKENRPYAKIYLESIYPINKTDDDKINGYVRDFSISNDDIVDINKKLESLAKDENITYIDMFNELVDSDGNLKLEYTEEGLHMSDDGYDKITEVLIKYIKEND